MEYHDLPEVTGCGTCNSCKHHTMDGRNHQCQNPSKPDSWHNFINETFARNYHDCCVLHPEEEDKYASDDWA